MQTRSTTRRMNAAAATVQTTQTAPSVNVIQEQNTPASSRGAAFASSVGAKEDIEGGSSSSKALRTAAPLPPPNKLRTTISDEEKARSMEMFDPLSEASHFTGPLTPYSSTHRPIIPLPSEFDVLVKTDLEWKEKQVDRTDRTMLEVELDIMIFKKRYREELLTKLSKIPDNNNTDMVVDSAMIVDTPIVTMLGPEGTIIIDPVEEAREFSRQQAEADYPSEWVERAGESQELRTHPTELITE